MSDNVAITPGTGAAIATDEVTGTGEHVQLVKIASSADGSRALVPADGDGLLVRADNLDLALTALRDALRGVSDKTLTDVVSALGSLAVSISGSVAVTGPLTDMQLRAADVKVTLDGESVPVTGTFWQGTQPISAATLPLPSGAATAALQTQPGVDIGDVTVNNGAGASAVNIQDGGNSITVDGALTVNAGTNLNTSLLALEAGGNLATIAAKDFATQTTLALIKAKTDNLDVALSTRTTPADQQHVIIDSSASIAVTGGLTDTQLRASAVPVSLAALPAGTNVLGHVINDSGSTTVVTGNVTVVQPTGTNLHTVVDSAPTTAVTHANLDVALSTLAKESGGNLATIAGKDFATSAKQDTAQTALDAIKTDVDKLPSLGQALAGSSMPVVLTAAQVATLTPPAALVGFALEAGNLASVKTALETIDNFISGARGLVTEDNSASIAGSVATIATNTTSIATAALQTAANATLESLTVTPGVISADVIGPLVQGVVSDTVQTLTPDTVNPLQLTTDGRLRVITVEESYNNQAWGSLWSYGSDTGGDFPTVHTW